MKMEPLENMVLTDVRVYVCVYDHSSWIRFFRLALFI